MKEAAEVLENAARAYRDEKIEWCAGDWARLTEGTWDPNTPRWSMCAEGALMTASGITIMGIQAFNRGNDWDEHYPNRDAIDTYTQAKLAFQAWIRDHSAFNDVVAFNDGQGVTYPEIPIPNTNWSSVHKERDEVLAKEAVISAMEQCAKDLRNRPPRKELPVL